MRVLVKILEGREAGPVFLVARLVHILLILVGDTTRDRKAEEAAGARKARRAEAEVRIEWPAAAGLPQGSSGGAPLGKEGAPGQPC